MKRIFSLLIALVAMFNLSVSAAEQGDNLVITTKDGQQVTYLLSERPVVTFEGTDLVLKVSDVTVNYPLADVVDITFDLTTGIQNVKVTDKVAFTINPSEIAAQGLKAGDAMQIYTVDGKLILNGTAGENGSVNLSTEGLNHGVYVVKAGRKSYKIIK